MTPELFQVFETRGFFVVRAPFGAELASRAPFHCAEAALEWPVAMAEHQPIRPVPEGRSFASTMVETPLHTDSQLYRGAPPDVQLLLCVRPANQGGEPTLLDGFSVVEHIEKAEPDLHRALFFTNRKIPFVFGDVFGPTVALRRGRLSIVYSPMPAQGDAIAERLAPYVAKAPRFEVKLDAGDLLVVDNRRMLHGRRVFSDPGRELCRLLCWLRAPLPEPPALRSLAEQAARALGAPIEEPPETTGDVRLRIVLQMLRGQPPGVLSAREGIPEPELYRMRDEALRAAERALSRDRPKAREPGIFSRILGKRRH